MHRVRATTSLFSAVLLLGSWAWAQGTDAATKAKPAPQLGLPAGSAASFDQVVDRIVEREHFFVAQMRHLHPLAETYIQNLKEQKETGLMPVSDEYFLGRVDFSNGADDHSFMGEPGFGHRVISKLTNLYSMKFLPLGFAQMVMLDEDFQKKSYDL